MGTKVIRCRAPEEGGLSKKQAMLGQVEDKLAERELSLTNLRAEISGFQSRYLAHVAALYAELDQWNAKIAELKAQQEGTLEAWDAAAVARTQAAESSVAVSGQKTAPAGFTASAELKSLYRELAKRGHPDRALDQTDHDQRERWMAEASTAYQRGDAETLKRILEVYASNPAQVGDAGTAAELARVIRQLRRRLAEVEREISGLNTSDIAKLKARVEEADSMGHDLLAEMAAGRIEIARRRFEDCASGLEKP